MGRPAGPKVRCGGRWTESRFDSFIRSLLRSGSRKWAPINDVKKEARQSRGMYLCAGCGAIVPNSLKQGRKRVKNVFVDHIDPIVDPELGFQGYDVFIERLFCEADNLQLLCGECHDEKSMKERKQAASRRQSEKHIREPVEEEGNPLI